MAKARPLIAEMSGSMADVVFSHNKGGSYVRRRSVPTNPNSSRQQLVRTSLANVSSSWSGNLEQGERDAWNVYAQTHPVTDNLGQEISLTGHQWFVRLNQRALQINPVGLPVQNPPVGGDPIADVEAIQVVVEQGASSGPGDINLTWVGTTFAGFHIGIWCSPPLSAGQDPNQRQSRLCGYTALAPTSPNAALNTWCTVVQGQFLNVWIHVAKPDGQVTPWVKRRIEVQAAP